MGKLFEHTDKIVNEYAAGKSLRELAEELGVSSGSVRTVLKKSGATLRSRGRRPSATVASLQATQETN